MSYTIHGVLAGAYRGKDVADRTLLTHASLDNGETSLCARVRRHGLFDEALDPQETSTTCSQCKRALSRRGLLK